MNKRLEMLIQIRMYTKLPVPGILIGRHYRERVFNGEFAWQIRP